jgi:hypothetical protein
VNRPRIIITIAVITAGTLAYSFVTFHAGFWRSSDKPSNNVNQEQTNINSMVLIAPTDEAGWDIYWNDLVEKARQESSTTKFGSLNFQIPKSMIQSTSGEGTYYAFNPVPEGSVMGFEVVGLKPVAVISEVKDSLGEFEKIITEKTEVINGVKWQMIRHTTDIGIDQVIWVTLEPTGSLRITYPEARKNTTDLFEEIVHSVRKTL